MVDEFPVTTDGGTAFACDRIVDAFVEDIESNAKSDLIFIGVEVELPTTVEHPPCTDVTCIVFILGGTPGHFTLTHTISL